MPAVVDTLQEVRALIRVAQLQSHGTVHEVALADAMVALYNVVPELEVAMHSRRIFFPGWRAQILAALLQPPGHVRESALSRTLGRFYFLLVDLEDILLDENSESESAGTASERSLAAMSTSVGDASDRGSEDSEDMDIR